MRTRRAARRSASFCRYALAATSLVGASACKQAAPVDQGASPAELSTGAPVAADERAERGGAPLNTTMPFRPNPAPLDTQPPPTSPFLVTSPQAPPLQAPSPFTSPAPPPQPSPQFASPPPPRPTPWPPTPPPQPAGRCPPDRCFLNGKCLIPGGPIMGPNAPPGAVSGLCGHGGDCHPCRCASPGTPVATPLGDVPIERLRRGDEVLSVHQGKVVVVPILATQRVAVRDHAVARVRLAGGAVFEISGEHPLADGRSLFDLRPGERVGGAEVEELSLVPYAYPATFDVLPDSDSGAYLVNGIWLGSTMSRSYSSDAGVSAASASGAAPGQGSSTSSNRP